MAINHAYETLIKYIIKFHIIKEKTPLNKTSLSKPNLSKILSFTIIEASNTF